MYLVIFFLCLVLLIWEINNRNNKAKAYDLIGDTNGEREAKIFIRSNNFLNTNPLDEYKIGSLYDFVLKDPRRAEYHYINALRIPDPFIETKIADRVAYRDPEISAVETSRLSNKLKKISGNKTLDIKWTSDSQNVHDSIINNEVERQYRQIIREQKCSMDDVIDYISHVKLGPLDKKNRADAIEMLKYIKQKNPHISKLNDSECNFVRNLFEEIYSRNNPVLIENFILNLKEAYSGGSPVCITGRTARLMSSITDSLKSRPVIKNELLAISSAVRDKILKDEKLMKIYNGEKTPESDALCDRIYEESEKQIKEHEYYLKEKTFCDSVLEEIKQAI